MKSEEVAFVKVPEIYRKAQEHIVEVTTAIIFGEFHSQVEAFLHKLT